MMPLARWAHPCFSYVFLGVFGVRTTNNALAEL